MKKFTILTFLFSLNFALAQDFQGKAEYFSKFILKNKHSDSDAKIDKDVDPEFQKVIDEAIKKASEKKYSLIFNKTESLFEEEKELTKPQAGSMVVTIDFSGGGKKYLNLKENITKCEDEIFGKEFLIEEPLKKMEWKLIDETKKIGDYTCQKAELIIPVSEKDLKEYEEFLKRDAVKPQLFKMDKPQDKKIVAWYTPEIPVALGPNNYWGLSGLILELNEENLIFLCSKVTLSNKAKYTINPPSNGKKVSQKEFDEIEKKKLDSMRDEDGNIIFQTTD
ncbi:MAG TPA: GLPGLI family protein [Flavobacterium lutivivi]|nr:GLPGLI family protein [Flavobacterium lutivivi]